MLNQVNTLFISIAHCVAHVLYFVSGIKQCAYYTALFWIAYQPHVSVHGIVKQQPIVCDYALMI